MKLPRRIFFCLAVLLALAAPARGPTHAEVFLSVLDDVPVMPGMAELAGEAVVFDAPAGRIVSTAITGHESEGLDPGAVLSFYGATLPALGWHARSRTRFVRDGEVLTLALERRKGRIRLDFDLRPQ